MPGRVSSSSSMDNGPGEAETWILLQAHNRNEMDIVTDFVLSPNSSRCAAVVCPT